MKLPRHDEWNYHSSSLIFKSYYTDDNELLINFCGNDDIYIYYDVPCKVWMGFDAAKSVGTYYNRYIKGKYKSAKYSKLLKEEKKKLTTDFQIDVAEGNDFWLGHVVNTHQIGQYQFLEWWDKNLSKSQFSVYINEKSTGQSYPSLETAMIGAICLNKNMYNSDAPRLISKMLDLE